MLAKKLLSKMDSVFTLGTTVFVGAWMGILTYQVVRNQRSIQGLKRQVEDLAWTSEEDSEIYTESEDSEIEDSEIETEDLGLECTLNFEGTGMPLDADDLRAELDTGGYIPPVHSLEGLDLSGVATGLEEVKTYLDTIPQDRQNLMSEFMMGQMARRGAHYSRQFKNMLNNPQIQEIFRQKGLNVGDLEEFKQILNLVEDKAVDVQYGEETTLDEETKAELDTLWRKISNKVEEVRGRKV